MRRIYTRPCRFTTATCGPSLRDTTVSPGTTSGRNASVSLNFTYPNIPGNNSPLGLGTNTTVSMVRDAGSSAEFVSITVPGNTRPGNCSTVSWAGCFTVLRIGATYVCGTLT